MSAGMGWYPDPDDPNARRYWDGETWGPPLPTPEASPGMEIQPQTAATATTGRRSWLLAAVAGGVAVAVAAVLVVYFFTGSTDMTVRGTLDIQGSPSSGVYTVSAPDAIGNTSCVGVGGFSDISPGVAVVVTNDGGKTIGTGSLEDGIYISGADACIFGFQVKVPDGLGSYGITVSHRGTLQFTTSQMKAGPDLTLGSS